MEMRKAANHSEILSELLSFDGKDIENFRYKSICRLNILERVG